MSVGLIIALIVAIAVVLSLAVDNDDQTDRTAAPAAPLSYIHDGMGEGFVSGEDQAVVPATRAYTGEHQGDGLVNTADDLSVNRPVDRPTGSYHPYTGEIGLTEGSDALLWQEQARRMNDAMLFEQWNDPLGWQATSEPEPQAVLSYEEMLFLEQNGVYDIERHLAGAPALPTVDLYARMRFIEINTYLPGWTDDLPQPRGHGQLTEY